jgi:hypothetical protein
MEQTYSPESIKKKKKKVWYSMRKNSIELIKDFSNNQLILECGTCHEIYKIQWYISYKYTSSKYTLISPYSNEDNKMNYTDETDMINHLKRWGCGFCKTSYDIKRDRKDNIITICCKDCDKCEIRFKCLSTTVVKFNHNLSEDFNKVFVNNTEWTYYLGVR